MNERAQGGTGAQGAIHAQGTTHAQYATHAQGATQQHMIQTLGYPGRESKAVIPPSP